MNTPSPATATARTELPAPSSATLAEMHAREHATCFACGSTGAHGLGLSFRLSTDGTSVLDSAMVHALFARGCSARTADLHLRYRQPVQPAAPCRIEGRLVSRRGGAFQLEATLHQAGLLCARAAATFMRSADFNPPDFIAS